MFISYKVSRAGYIVFILKLLIFLKIRIIEIALFIKFAKNSKIEFFIIIIIDIKKILKKKKYLDSITLFLLKYYNFLDIFS